MIIQCPEKTLLKTFLMKNGISLRTACGGRGNCGKCAVRIIKGDASVNTMDKAWFSEEQLQQGYRLGCQVYTKETVTVEVNEDDWTAVHP